jgi:2-dehydropantoate 2-reductase
MRVVVVGAGAMGGLFGAKLASTGHDVLLFDTWNEHVAAIERLGLSIEGVDGTIVRYRVRATDRPPQAIATAELILVQVKAYDTLAALTPFRGRLNAETFVLSLQNGLSNLEQMREAVPGHDRLLLGTTAHGATMLGPGRIRHAGKGMTMIGDPASPHEPRFDLQPIRAAFARAGFETDIVSNIHSAIWAKLVSNVAINPITALTGLHNGELLDDPEIQRLVEAVVTETVAVMRAAGVPTVMVDYLKHTRRVMEQTRSNVSSMLQDIRRGRPTEIDAINGAVARLADELGVPAPVNHYLAALVRHRERDAMRGNREQGTGNRG